MEVGRGIASSAATAAEAVLSPRNIWCVGRNYAEHVKELGNAMQTEEPMIFLKAGTTALAPGTPLVLPVWSKDVHHEIELALELGPDLQPRRLAAALDLTARDVQAKLKKQQWPWSLAKSFPASCPLATPAPIAPGLDLAKLRLVLEVNGKVRQDGNTADMIFKVPVLLQYVTKHFPVAPGDVVLTGTPHGVSKLADGDRLVARVLGPDGAVLSEGAWDVSAPAQ